MRVLFFLSIFVISLIIAGCGGGSAVPNANTANANIPKADSNNPLAVKTPIPESTTNNAPTLTPVYKAYCDAKIKNDETALRKVYSSDAIRDFEDKMKRAKVGSLVKFLEDDRVSGKLCEARNEQITGDSAIAEVRSDSYPNGIKVIFVKENGEWKMTNRSPALELKSSSSNSNVAR